MGPAMSHSEGGRPHASSTVGTPAPGAKSRGGSMRLGRASGSGGIAGSGPLPPQSASAARAGAPMPGP
jgi:hypothetical protein